MSQKLGLSEFIASSTQGTVFKYIRKSDKTCFSVKPLPLSSHISPEDLHCLLQNYENLSQHSHPNLAQYHGYAIEKDQKSQKLLVFYEASEQVLADYLQNRYLTNREVSTLFQELVDVLIFLDRTADALPSFITPNNILIVKDKQGEKHFKLFGTSTYDEDQKINEENLKWTAPEEYARVKFKRTDIRVNPEKAVFYSLAMLVLYCATKGLVSQQRSQVGEENSVRVDENIERKNIAVIRSKFLSQTKNEMLNKMIGKLLVNPEKRPDFRVWQLKYLSVQDQVNQSNHKTDLTENVENGEGHRLDQSTDEDFLLNQQSLLQNNVLFESNEKGACCNHCSIF